MIYYQLTEMSEPVVLSCSLPKDATPGSTLHIVAPDKKYYEITVPDNVSSGDTIHILINSSTYENLSPSQIVFLRAQKLAKDLLATATKTATTLDAKYNIVNRVQELDQRYSITTRAQNWADPIIKRAWVYDENYKVSQRINDVVQYIIVLAREIDERYAVSAVAAQVVLFASDTIRSALKPFVTDNQAITPAKVIEIENTTATVVEPPSLPIS
eukprot:CAMPEP_0196764432 /NCGR_PEP_ID=MMETSP1095-20130614/6113_1 /TAXON_ID=96789 ORGANISM="Chromulina nebulosa, Strain UTEXLB2642" /NCGR_SAMPLE_ID=MMETSP1095 /ASSEMBLY_ACC=CAM_ASM_000446 /LENGTH=213 /DNA_ID=CAMNT_0042120013 /DNA_START=578 /DNA_END=1219 /DNA_ORIENTATION=+